MSHSHLKSPKASLTLSQSTSSSYLCLNVLCKVAPDHLSDSTRTTHSFPCSSHNSLHSLLLTLQLAHLVNKAVLSARNAFGLDVLMASSFLYLRSWLAVTSQGVDMPLTAQAKVVYYMVCDSISIFLTVSTIL